MRPHVVTIALVLFSFLASPSGVRASGTERAGGGAWAVEPFTASPQELVEAASVVPPDDDHGVQVLLQEVRYELDDTGRVDFRFRLVYRVDSPESVSSWSRVSRTWQPWYQNEPEIRARVVSAEGDEYVLDPGSLGEYGDSQDGPDVYGDERTLKGPLPGVAVGAVVEEEHRIRDHRARFESGVIRMHIVGYTVPVQTARVILEAPASLPLRYKLYRLPGVTAERTESDGRVRVVVEAGPLEAWDHDDRMAPGDVSRRPAVALSTGESWGEIAAAYGAIVDERVASSDMQRVVKRTIGKETDRDRIIEALLAEVHDRVRYTGVEFGESSIVPAAPSLTLERRFGDCKDKATLLVAMLRQANIDARVALLNTGPGFDVDPELPGMGRFDHAIVHVPPSTWIDPTDPYARAGELPSRDQGRLALIAAPSVGELVRTPKAPAQANVRTESREVFLPREGRARIVETTEVRGAFDREYRHSFGNVNESGAREKLERYVKDQYLAESLGETTITDVRDLSRPLTLTLEARECGRARTTSTQATVVIPAGTLIRELPDVLKPSEEPSPREFPVELTAPHRVHIDYHIIPPPGYRLASKPDDGTRRFGPAVMTQAYAEQDDGTVTGSLTFETPTPLFTVDQVEDIRRELKAFYEEPMPEVVFHNVGEKHLEAGRLREALETFRSLAEEYPEEPLYRTQMARAYLAAGLGANARREARRAVELAPDSAAAHLTAGVILAHDLLGRKFVEGFDHAGAETELRAAVEIDPDNSIALGELAILLEHDAEGARYTRGAGMDESIELHERRRTGLEDEGLTSNLAVLLLRTEQFAKLKTLWEDAPRDTTRDSLYIAAVAATDGVERAMAEASRLADQPAYYREILAGASNGLASVRRYEEAAAAMAAAAKGDQDSISRLNQAQVLGRVKRHERTPVDEMTPEGLVRSFMVELFAGGQDGDPLRFLMDGLLEGAHQATLDEMSDDVRAVAHRMRTQYGITDDQYRDYLVSLATLTTESDENIGHRVRVRITIPEVGDLPVLWFYVAPDGERLALAGCSLLPSITGRHVLHLADAGRLDTARRWLDWAAADTFTGGGFDVLATEPLQFLWTPGDEADEQRIRIAAAGLMASDGLYRDETVEMLQQARAGLSDDGDARRVTGIDLALLRLGEILERPELQLDAASRLTEAHPRSSLAFSRAVVALVRLGRFDEAKERVDSRFEAFPGDDTVASMWADVVGSRGDLTEYRRRLTRLVDQGRATEAEYNNLAWLDIVEERVSEPTLVYAQQAVTMDDYGNSASLHTLATVYAELGQVAEARDVLMAVLENRPTRNLESPDWYVLGRLAEHYGAPDAAREAYDKVEPPEHGAPEATSTWRLARRRLAALDGKVHTAPDGDGR